MTVSNLLQIYSAHFFIPILYVELQSKLKWNAYTVYTPIGGKGRCSTRREIRFTIHK